MPHNMLIIINVIENLSKVYRLIAIYSFIDNIRSMKHHFTVCELLQYYKYIVTVTTGIFQTSLKLNQSIGGV